MSNVNKIKCPNCTKAISVQSEVCPYCHTRFDLEPAITSKNNSFKKKINSFFSKIKSPEKRTQQLKNDKGKLISLNEISAEYKTGSQSYQGVKEIKINDVVGSLDRYKDFNRYFLPVKGFTTRKLDPIVAKMKKGIELPPVKVYEVASKYFVVDGHHRIAASLLLNREYIDAEVTGINIKLELEEKKQPRVSSEELKFFIIDLERKQFEKKTYLYRNILSYPPEVTHIASFGKLYDDILAHHHSNLELNKHTSIIVSALEWYKHKFLPIIRIIKDYELLSRLDQRTATDLYVWLLMHQYVLSMETGQQIGFKQTVADFIKVNGKEKYYDQLPVRYDSYLRYIAGEK